MCRFFKDFFTFIHPLTCHLCHWFDSFLSISLLKDFSSKSMVESNHNVDTGPISWTSKLNNLVNRTRGSIMPGRKLSFLFSLSQAQQTFSPTESRFRCLFLNPCFQHFILHQVFTRYRLHVASKHVSTLWLIPHSRLLPSALWRQAGSCKQVRWGLSLCGLVMLRCLNSTKIRCRWQCRAQCSGPCLRIAPVPLIPMSLGQPPAVFRSVYSTRHNKSR